MPAPAAAAYFVAAGITAFVTGYVFVRFVYEPHIAPALERIAEDFLERRRARSRHLAAPVDAARPSPSGGDNSNDDIPLERTRRRVIRRMRTSFPPDESGDEESAPLLGAQSSATARELDGNDNTSLLRRRPVPAVPAVDNVLSEPPVPLGSTREEVDVNESGNSITSLPTRPVAFDSRSRSTPDILLGSEHYHQGTPVPVTVQDNRRRLEPTVTYDEVSPLDVHEWRNTVAFHEDSRRHGQGQPMRPIVIRRPPPPASTASTVSAVPAAPSSRPLHILDEPIPESQTPIYPTHVIADSSVPSTPSTTSGARNVLFTPPPQMSPLRSSAVTVSTTADANGANPSEANVLDPWNGAVPPHVVQGGELNVSIPTMTQSTTTIASSQADSNPNNSSIPQLLVPVSGAIAPQLPPLSPLSSMYASTSSIKPTSIKPSQPYATQSPQSPPYLLTPSAQHPHHVHYPAPPNIASVASSSNTPSGATSATLRAHPQTKSPPPISPMSTLSSQSYPISQDQGIEIVSNPTPSASPFRSPSYSDPIDLAVPGSPGPFGSPGLQGSPTSAPSSPFIPLSIPPLPIPISPNAGRTGTGGEQIRQHPLSLGSASSMMTTTTTIRQSTSPNLPLLPSPTNSMSMFYSFTNDGSAAARQTLSASPQARPPPPPPPPLPPVAPFGGGSMLSFPSELTNQQQKFASPGMASPMLSELDIVSEFGGSELGSNDDIGSESGWSSFGSTRF